MESWVGKTLGKVQIEALIGRGGVAEVYLGMHTTLDRKVAVKILRNLDEEDTDKLERFKREARVIARLRHPNIVQIHDFDTIDSNPYLVMEYIEGPSLSKYLNTLHQNRLRLPLPQVIRMLRAVASALQYAHNNGIVHRDVKPGNILLTSPSSKITVGKPLPEDFEPVLTDFGLVRFQDGHRQTTTGHIAGTPAYMSPEQSRGEAVDGRADVYSLGIVLYEMLAGDVPFDGESTVSILLKQVSEPPRPIPGLPPLFQNVLDRALAKNARDRFQTPMELADAFTGVMSMKNEAQTIQFNELPTILPSAAVPVVQTASPSPAKVEEPARPPKRWLFVAVPSLLLLALGGFFWVNNLPSSAPPDFTATFSPSPSATYTLTNTPLPASATNTQVAVIPSGPVGVLHFQNHDALVDGVSLTTQSMPPPPFGYQYQIWLKGPNKRLSLGILTPDSTGKAELIFSSSDSVNLLSLYGELEITIEPDPDPDPKPSDLIAFAYALPKDGLDQVRFLLSAFSKTPDKNGLAQGLYADTQQIAQWAQEIQSASAGGDQAAVQRTAEAALNLVVGSRSPDYRDWNGDGKKEPRKSYGLLPNGDSFGYIQAVYKDADFTVSSSGATSYMVTHGSVVKICTQNMTQWAPELRTLLMAILDPASGASSPESITRLVTLTEQMLNGIDTDKNGKVDEVAGECGAKATYEHAYRMADIPILPASISYQLTQVANTAAPLTGTPNPNAGGPQVGFTPGMTTPQATNTKRPTPTKKVVSTPANPPPGGGGGGGGGGKPTKKPPKVK